ncbi:hypothetical protein QIA36_05705 (plasmid) [Borreliella yangtzensis]
MSGTDIEVKVDVKESVDNNGTGDAPNRLAVAKLLCQSKAQNQQSRQVI